LDEETRASLEKGEVLLPRAPVVSCPLEASLALFGKKWTLMILGDISMRKKERFNDPLKSLPGISPRILSRRLHELESSGLISRNVNDSSLESSRWKVTEKGWDALPILYSYAVFGSK
jgi:DNA-binding HxlR family transcriptional regulator